MASTAFALVFLWLWRGRAATVYLAHWAISLILYIVVMLSYERLGGAPGAIHGALLIAILTGSNLFVVSGVAVFEGRPPFAAWMALPSLVSVIGFVAGGREMAAYGLALGMILFGTALVRGGPGTTRGRRIAGVALLGYIPGYACAIVAGMTAHAGIDRLAAIAMLSDQLLLPVLYLGLLAMPGEREIAGLRDVALRDPLTGAHNRRWLAQEDATLTVPGTAVILFDIDHFKTINDRFGHAGGDAVLGLLARRMTLLCAAEGGVMVRLGGDEFLILLPGAYDATARHAERVRDAAAVVAPGVPGCTVSVGIDAVVEGEQTLSDAILRADRALYRAKATGRDRVAA